MRSHRLPGTSVEAETDQAAQVVGETVSLSDRWRWLVLTPTFGELETIMAQIRIHHRTIYRYRQAVDLGPHRLMLRPRERRDLRLLSHQVSVTPQAQVSWATDVFGNAVATAVFNEMADVLTVDSVASVDLTASAWPVFAIAGSALTFPFRYSDKE